MRSCKQRRGGAPSPLQDLPAAQGASRCPRHRDREAAVGQR